MKTLQFGQLRESNLKRREDTFHPLDAWSPTDWAIAMAAECAEVCNLIKELRRLADRGSDGAPAVAAALRALIAKELADTVIYADLLAARLGIDLGDAVVEKFNEVSRRVGSTVFLAL